MADADTILAGARSVLVVDWPSRDVPDALARAGLDVVVHGGPGPDDYSAYEMVDGDVVVDGWAARRRAPRWCTPTGLSPSCRRAVASALAVGAGAVWIQSGRAPDGAQDPRGCWLSEEDAAQARAVVEAAGLDYLDQPYIADVARRLGR